MSPRELARKGRAAPHAEAMSVHSTHEGKLGQSEVDLMASTLELADPIPEDWRREFEAAARRPLRQRFRYAFIHTYKPVMDDARFRAFETMADYRNWCETHLPSWLGYGREV